jgi:hypothetical protein
MPDLTGDANVQRLRVPLEANVPTSTIPLQFSIAQDTNRLVATDVAGTGIDFGVSDDSLQLLLAGAQTVTGVKTIDSNMEFETNRQLIFNYPGGPALVIEADGVGQGIPTIDGQNSPDFFILASSGNLDLNASGYVNLRANWTDVARVYENHLNVRGTKALRLGTDLGLGDTEYTELNQNGGLLTIQNNYTNGVGDVKIISGQSGDIWLNAQEYIRFGFHSALGAETVTGYIEILDDGGTTRKLAVVS